MSSPARALQAARREAGLSQEELARRSEVSERTIRSLESGNAKRPHRDTLVAVSSGLGMTGADVDAFVALWRTPSRSIHELLGARDPIGAVNLELAEEMRCIKERTTDFVARIGPDRRWRTVTVRRKIEVIAGAFDRYTELTGYDRETIDPDKFEMTEWANIEPGLTVAFREVGAKAFVVLLERTLTAGEVYRFEHTVDYGPAYRSASAYSAEDDEICVAVREPMERLSFDVRFAAEAPPRRVRVVRQDSLDHVAGDGPGVPMSRFGVSQLTLEPASVGVHGIRWEWD